MPLPPKKADVVQKSHPIGQPTDGMIVAARRPVPWAGEPHDAEAERRREGGWAMGCEGSSPRIRRIHATPSPFTKWSASTHPLDARESRDVPAYDDRRVRRVLAHEAAHLADLADVDDDSRDADDVVAAAGELARRSAHGWEVEQRRWRGDVVLDELDAPRPVEHPKRERALFAGHLVLVPLHRVDGPAAELVVLGVRPEYRREEDSGVNALGMSCLCHDADLLWQTPGPQEFGRPGRNPWCAERAAVTREDAIGLGRGRTAATRAAATRKQLGGLLQCTRLASPRGQRR